MNNIVNLTCNILNLTPPNINTSIQETGVPVHYLHIYVPHTNCDKIEPTIQVGFPNGPSMQNLKVFRMELSQLLQKERIAHI